jgi:DNA ligase-1
MRLERLADTTAALRATSSRKAKSELLAELLRLLDPPEIIPAVGMLLAQPRQGAIGVGWATVASTSTSTTTSASPSSAGADPAGGTGVEILDFDRLISELAVTTGAGSEARRVGLLEGFLGRCTPAEEDFVRRVLVGDARQGALGGVMTDAGAKAAGVKAAVMRRAVMLQGDLGQTSGVTRSSHASIRGMRARTELTFQVANRTGQK